MVASNWHNCKLRPPPDAARSRGNADALLEKSKKNLHKSAGVQYATCIIAFFVCTTHIWHILRESTSGQSESVPMAHRQFLANRGQQTHFGLSLDRPRNTENTRCKLDWQNATSKLAFHHFKVLYGVEAEVKSLVFKLCFSQWWRWNIYKCVF